MRFFSWSNTKHSCERRERYFSLVAMRLLMSNLKWGIMLKMKTDWRKLVIRLLVFERIRSSFWNEPCSQNLLILVTWFITNYHEELLLFDIMTYAKTLEPEAVPRHALSKMWLTYCAGYTGLLTLNENLGERCQKHKGNTRHSKKPWIKSMEELRNRKEPGKIRRLSCCTECFSWFMNWMPLLSSWKLHLFHACLKMWLLLPFKNISCQH